MKKVLSLLLAVLMVFTLLPVSALADGETPGTAETTAETETTPVPEVTPEPETTPEPENTPEPARVTVRFNCMPEDTEITVYEKAAFELAKTDGTEAEKLVAEEDGSYRLIPGCYIYMAACDGYFPAEEVEFAVDPDCDEMYVDIELEPMDQVLQGNLLVAVRNAPVSRDDGVWLWPLSSSYYNSFSDWAGCFGNDSTCSVCGTSHTSSWGDSYHGGQGGHNGFDISVATGNSVYAAASGTIILAE